MHSIEAIWLQSWSERGPKRHARDHEHEMLALVEAVGIEHLAIHSVQTIL